MSSNTSLSCYSFERAKKNWQDANSTCEEKNSHLIIIESQAENDFIKSAVPDNSQDWWIGATDHALQDWQWVDSSALNFTDWLSGQPDGGTVEDCAQMWEGAGLEWTDCPCNELQFFVCEYDYYV
jgi:hypothetical protein